MIVVFVYYHQKGVNMNNNNSIANQLYKERKITLHEFSIMKWEEIQKSWQRNSKQNLNKENKQ